MSANRATACPLFADEQDVRRIEDAVKAAIAAVLQVFCAVSTARMQECRRKAAEAQRENNRLRLQLEAAERELLRLRRFKGSLETTGAAGGAGGGVAGDPRCGCSVPSAPPPMLRAHPKEPPSEPTWEGDLSSPCEETDTPVNPQASNDASHIKEVSFTEVFNQQSHGKKPANVSSFEVPVEPKRNPRPPVSPGNHLHVKEEPPDFETVYVKCEVSEEQVRDEDGSPGSSCPLWKKDEPHTSLIPLNTLLPPGDEAQGATGACDVPSALMTSLAQRISNRERQKRYREKIRADPERQRIYRERDRCRYQKRRKLICELPEQSQNLRRQAWREAARRHRARKKSCIQMAQFPSLEEMEPVVHLES